MKFDNEKNNKRSNNEILLEFRGTAFRYELRLSSAELAEINRRIVREINDFHKPIFIARNNK